MESWDSRYPFSADEINLFSRLHQKATKFPAPVGLLKDTEQQIEQDEQGTMPPLPLIDENAQM